MRSADNEAVVLRMWDDYEREGLPGILRWAADDAVWQPHSSERRTFHGTAEYRAAVETAFASGLRVESIRTGIWSHDDLVFVRGRLRTRQGGVLDDTRMYWVHRLRDGKIAWTGSSPDLGSLIRRVGVKDRGLAQTALLGLHET